jgi:hypothetical protein
MSDQLQDEITRRRQNPPYPGAKRIHDDLIRDRADLEQRGIIRPGETLPAVRPIGRLLEKIRDMSPAERRRFQLAFWPDAFGTPDLPWESAGAVTELTRLMGRPPEIPLASWFWKTRLALPGAEPRLCRAWATAFMLADLVPSWPSIVRQRLYEGYDPVPYPDSIGALDSIDMGALIHGERMPTVAEKLAMVKGDDDGTQG